MRIVESMRQEWDARARKDAFYYIASSRKDWNISDFLKSGEEDYQRFVAPAFNRCGFSPNTKRMLELGCGTGRMTHCFATYFDHVTAVDVSAQMLARAQEILHGVRNISWVQANGVDLREVASQCVDFAFSYLVLQHLPDEKVACAYVGEMLRVLTLSGICIFQFNGANVPTMNWKGRLGWGCVDALWMIHLPEVSRGDWDSIQKWRVEPGAAYPWRHGLSLTQWMLPADPFSRCEERILRWHGAVQER